MPPDAEVELRIERLAHGGAGIAQWPDGRIAFVRGTVPGERVRAGLRRERPRHVEADCIAVLEAAPERCEAPCPVYGQCGGCSTQHIDPAFAFGQLVEAAREDLRRRLGPEAAARVEAGQPAGEVWRYRDRLRLHLDAAGQPGFHRAGSREHVAVRDCLLASEDLLEPLLALPAAWRRNWFRAGWRELSLSRDGTGNLFLDLQAARGGRGDLRPVSRWIEALLEQGSFAGVRFGTRHGGQTTQVPPADSSLPATPLGTFRQAHRTENQRLVEIVLAAAGPLPGRQVMDLYAGSGNFSLPAAQIGARVTAVEGDKAAVAALQAAARAADLPLEAITGNVASILDTWPPASPGATVILDPPREGAAAVLPRLLRLAPERIVYVSCHFHALLRDLQTLADQGWTLRTLVPVDMFPQTGQLEWVATLDPGAGDAT